MRGVESIKRMGKRVRGGRGGYGGAGDRRGKREEAMRWERRPDKGQVVQEDGGMLRWEGGTDKA